MLRNLSVVLWSIVAFVTKPGVGYPVSKASFRKHRWGVGHATSVFDRTSCHMAPVDTANLNRGDSYGASGNSTILSASDVATILQVTPPDEVPARKWKQAWLVLKYTTPLLHLLDRLKPPNSSLNVYCMWWKALSGNDKLSPVFDNALAFDLLPRGTRWLVRPFRWYPRLHHANVEIRTAFLDRSVEQCVKLHQTNDTKIRLVTMGAGYDVRSIKMAERNLVDKSYELDLPEVIHAKMKILTSKRFKRRRPQVRSDILPNTIPMNLNDLAGVRSALTSILRSSRDSKWHTIFLFEAVMIYLDDGVPESLLQVCTDVLNETNCRGSLCFADRLEHVPDGNKEVAEQELAKHGWDIVDWLPKPGLARHMGRAEQKRYS